MFSSCCLILHESCFPFQVLTLVALTDPTILTFRLTIQHAELHSIFYRNLIFFDEIPNCGMFSWKWAASPACCYVEHLGVVIAFVCSLQWWLGLSRIASIFIICFLCVHYDGTQWWGHHWCYLTVAVMASFVTHCCLLLVFVQFLLYVYSDSDPWCVCVSLVSCLSPLPIYVLDRKILKHSNPWWCCVTNCELIIFI